MTGRGQRFLRGSEEAALAGAPVATHQNGGRRSRQLDDVGEALAQIPETVP